jgi:hypothetical protein
MRTTAIFESELTKTGLPRSCDPVYSAARWASVKRTWLAWTPSPALYTGNHGRFDMKKLGLAFCMMMLLVLIAPTAPAAEIVLFDYGFNIDGTAYYPGDSVPINDAAFDYNTGLGTITATIAGIGYHRFIGFFDHEIDEVANTFFNENGEAVGSLASGQLWEIDEPYLIGNIYEHFEAGTLDNTNADIWPEDVSMAMGFEFTLAADETALVTLHLTQAPPAGGFYLHQWDPISQTDPNSPPPDIYLYGDSAIRGPGVIPEPSTIILVLSGLGLAVAAKFRRSV